jgi:16S rRNA (adenine1518-N6/adenine1519-N6)-dimethyltransferase
MRKELKNFFPKKSLGQNFLLNEKILDKIVSFCNLKKDDVALEIGSGIGNLTKKLAKKAKKVFAIEKDERLVKILARELGNQKNIKIIQGDILKINLKKLGIKKGYKVVGNLPYRIAKKVIQKFLNEKPKPKLMVVMVQKEVAKKICAKEGKLNILGAILQMISKPKIKMIVKKENFWPKPKVDGAILEIKPKNKRLEIHFLKVLKAGFSQPRKTIKNNLKKIFGKKVIQVLESLNIDPNLRPQELKLTSWEKLAKFFAKNNVNKK